MPRPQQLDSARLQLETPRLKATGYRCPHCEVVAKQDWYELFLSPIGGGPLSLLQRQDIVGRGGVCQACRLFTLWLNEAMVWPTTSTAPMPVEDMPHNVKADYMEARAVFSFSPRAAGGLLRIAFEKLFPHLGITKKSPNEAIGELVKKGLALGPLQQALDSMRIFANQTAHDGFVKLDDQPETVSFLFVLLNYIVEQMITRPKEINAMYKLIPQDKLDGIDKRDGKK